MDPGSLTDLVSSASFSSIYSGRSLREEDMYTPSKDSTKVNGNIPLEMISLLCESDNLRFLWLNSFLSLK